MEKKTNNRIRLGVFVILALFFFIIGLYLIGKRQQLFSSTFKVSGIFKDVSGLQVGNNVRFSGITVGIVGNIVITSDTTVRVDMLIRENVRKFIKKDATAVISSDGLMGNKILDITPGSSNQKPIENNDFLKTSVPVSIDQILSNVNVISENTANITGDLSNMIDYIASGKGTIGKLLMDSSFAANLGATVVNAKQASKGLKENMEAAKHNFLLRGFFKKKEKDKQKDLEKK